MTNNSQNELSVLERIITRMLEHLLDDPNYQEHIVSNLHQLNKDGNLTNSDLVEEAIKSNFGEQL